MSIDYGTPNYPLYFYKASLTTPPAERDAGSGGPCGPCVRSHAGFGYTLLQGDHYGLICATNGYISLS